MVSDADLLATPTLYVLDCEWGAPRSSTLEIIKIEC